MRKTRAGIISSSIRAFLRVALLFLLFLIAGTVAVLVLSVVCTLVLPAHMKPRWIPALSHLNAANIASTAYALPVVARALARRSLRWYLRQLHYLPFGTRALSAGVIFFLADMSGQLLSGAPRFIPFNFPRLARYTGYGFFVMGPFLYAWYSLMHEHGPEDDLAGALQKSLFEQFTLEPACICMYIIYDGIVCRKPFRETYHKLATQLGPLWFKNAIFWLPANFSNYYIGTPDLRVLFANLCSLFWNIYFSIKVNSFRSPTGATHARRHASSTVLPITADHNTGSISNTLASSNASSLSSAARASSTASSNASSIHANRAMPRKNRRFEASAGATFQPRHESSLASDNHISPTRYNVNDTTTYSHGKSAPAPVEVTMSPGSATAPNDNSLVSSPYLGFSKEPAESMSHSSSSSLLPPVPTAVVSSCPAMQDSLNEPAMFSGNAPLTFSLSPNASIEGDNAGFHRSASDDKNIFGLIPGAAASHTPSGDSHVVNIGATDNFTMLEEANQGVRTSDGSREAGKQYSSLSLLSSPSRSMAAAAVAAAAAAATVVNGVFLGSAGSGSNASGVGNTDALEASIGVEDMELEFKNADQLDYDRRDPASGSTVLTA